MAVVRGAPLGCGIEVLLLKRAQSRDHTSGAWVFPGGVLDEADYRAQALCDLPDAAASLRLQLPGGGLAFYAAAIRECFEECGLLIAHTRDGKPAAQSPGLAGLDFWQLCEHGGLRLSAARLHYIGHWLTPRGRAKRFDTRFFVAAAPQGQTAMPDGRETLHHAWVDPVQALADEGEFAANLMTPTRATLQCLSRLRSVREVIDWAAALGPIRCIEPRLAKSAGGLCTVTPDHPAYGELGKLDPQGHGSAWCELRPGEPVRLAAGIVRITDASGRNRYAVGSEHGGWEDVEADGARLIEQERIAIARDVSQLTPEWRKSADWLAPKRGFLIDLRG